MVAIKDFDMPPNCISCKIGDNVFNCPCKGSTLIFDYQDRRHSNCPLVEIEERKVGKWIFSEGTKGKDNVEKCSCCGSHWKEAIIYRTDTKEYLRTRLLYCPNCGAEMRGSKE